MNKQRTTLSLPKGLPDLARMSGVNMSAVSAVAIRQEIKRIEKQTGAIAAKLNAPAAGPNDGRA